MAEPDPSRALSSLLPSSTSTTTKSAPNAPLMHIPGLLPSLSDVSTSTIDTDLTVLTTMQDEGSEPNITLVGDSQGSASPTSFLKHDTSSSSDERASSVDSFPQHEAKKGAKRT